VTEQDGRAISFVVTLDNLMAAGRLYQGRIRALSAAVEGVMMLSGVLLVFLGNSTGLFLVFIGAAFFVIDRTSVLVRMQTKRQARSVLGTSRDCVISTAGLWFRTVTSTGEAAWSSMTEIRDNAETVLFFRDRILLYYIPASAFDSPEDKMQVVRDCRRRIELAAHSPEKRASSSLL
jgi:hypothetical protein